jgi:hypothetical protein
MTTGRSNSGLGSISFARGSNQNSTLQNSFAVKSSDHSWLLRSYFRFAGGVFAKRYRRMM